MTLTFLGVYMALAVVFYLRLTATATGSMTPKLEKHSHWHRTRRMTKAFLRRVRPLQRKH